MQSPVEKIRMPRELRSHPTVLQWKRERRRLNEMAQYRVKKGLPLTDEALLNHARSVDALADEVMALYARF